MVERLERGWHELSGMKYFGSHPLPDMIHDVLREPAKFRRTSYCQICMREDSRCVCQTEEVGDIKERLNSIQPISIIRPTSEAEYLATHLGPFKEER